MADFKTHISTSTMIGMGYGALGLLQFQLSWPVCMVAGGLCSVAGILPDADSDSGQTVREITGFAAAVSPLLLLDHLEQIGISHHSMLLASGCLYIIIRFGLGELLRRITVHRGMWHSLPAAIIAGLVTSLVCSCEDNRVRFYKVGAVMLGYVTHLVLDEMYSVQVGRGRVRVKKSLGTALKIFGPSAWANTVTYGLLFAGLFLTSRDSMLFPGNGNRLTIHQMVRNLVFPNSSDSPTENPSDVRNQDFRSTGIFRNQPQLEESGSNQDEFWTRDLNELSPFPSDPATNPNTSSPNTTDRFQW